MIKSENEIPKECKTAAVIVAGGRGRRMNRDVPKQYIEIAGIPILVRTLQVFAAVPRMDVLVLVVPESDIAHCRSRMLLPYDLHEKVSLVQGGADRQDSVANGLSYLESLGFPDGGIVLIHDAVRPFVDGRIIDACLAGAFIHGAAVPGVPVVDTLKRADSRRQVNDTVSRENLYQIQTPQAFRFQVIRAAHAHAGDRDYRGTDDASLVEYMQTPVYLIQGSRHNIKITTPEDLDLGHYLLTLTDMSRE